MLKKENFYRRFNGNEKKYLTDILKRGLKSKKKTYNLILEKKWSKYHNLKYSITINSCTSALHVALLSLGCKKGDEVLVPSLTPVMCANAIIFTGIVVRLFSLQINLRGKSILSKPVIESSFERSSTTTTLDSKKCS